MGQLQCGRGLLPLPHAAAAPHACTSCHPPVDSTGLLAWWPAALPRAAAMRAKAAAWWPLEKEVGLSRRSCRHRHSAAIVVSSCRCSAGTTSCVRPRACRSSGRKPRSGSESSVRPVGMAVAVRAFRQAGAGGGGVGGKADCDAWGLVARLPATLHAAGAGVALSSRQGGGPRPAMRRRAGPAARRQAASSRRRALHVHAYHPTLATLALHAPACYWQASRSSPAGHGPHVACGGPLP